MPDQTQDTNTNEVQWQDKTDTSQLWSAPSSNRIQWHATPDVSLLKTTPPSTKSEKVQWHAEPDTTGLSNPSQITDPETKAAVARLQEHPIEGATFSAAPSIWQSLKTAVEHPINYMKEVEEDTQEGGGRTIVGRTLGHMQARGDQGYDATGNKTPMGSVLAGPLIGPPKVIRGALRIAAPPDPNKAVGDNFKEGVGGLNELVSGAMQTPGAAIAVLDPALLPKVIAGGTAQHYAEKGLTALGVPDEYAELGGNVAGVLGAHTLEDPAITVRGAAKASDTVVGKPVRGALKKILPEAAAPLIEEYAHVPGRTVGLESSEKALGSLNADVDVARSRLSLAERNLNKSKSAGLTPSEETTNVYNKAKSDFTNAMERQAVAEENIPLEKNITNRINIAKGSPSLASRIKNPNIVEAPSPSEYAERWRTPEKKAEYYGQSVLFGPEKPNVPYTRTPLVYEDEAPQARSASDELIPREIANVISSKPQSVKGASALGKIALPTDEQPTQQPTRTPLGRIESVIPEAGNIISNVEEKAHQLGTKLPAEPTDANTANPGLKPIDLSRLEPLLNQATGGRPLEPNVPLREQGLGKIQVSGEEPQKLSSDPRKAVLQKAGATREEITTILQRGSRFDPTSKVGLSKLAEHFGVDLGDSAIGRGQADVAAGTHLPPHEVLQRIVDAGHTPAEIVKAINEGKHLPPASGGSQGSEHAPTFYSKAERVTKEKVSTGSGDSMLSALRNNGVKESEIADLGLDDFLKGKSRVTKEDLQQFIAANKAELRDVELGGEKTEQLLRLSKARDAAFVENNRVWDDHLRRAPYSTELFNAIRDGDAQGIIEQMPKEVQEHAERFVATDNLIRNYDAAINKMSQKVAPTKYGKWTLPGDKSSYTEKLITLPQEPTSLLEWKQNHRGKWAWFSGRDQVSGAYPEESDIDNARQSIKVPAGARQFRSTHWEEPNVLAHVRYDERPSADGKKTLFLEELQSDWHQQGKQIGYSNPAPAKLPDGVHIIPDNGYFRVVNREGNPLLNRTYGTEQGAREAALKHYGEGAGNKGVPDAPFKNNWHELAMKKMLREAAEKGFERLAWTTGQQQADRYDLSKHIGSLEYDMDTKTLIARNPEGRKVLDEEMEPDHKELARYIGEGPAKKLMDQIENHPGPVDEEHLWNMYMDDYRVKEVPDPDDEEGSRYVVLYDGDREPLESFDTETAAHRYIEENVRFGIENYEREPNPSIHGLDLKTGGEWAKALYDRAIPNFLKSYAKKWGAKVGTTELSTSDPGSLRYEIVAPNGSVHDAFRNRAGAEEALQGYQENHRGPGQWMIKDTGTNEKVHSIEITPAMRKSLLEEGQPISKNEPQELIPTKPKGLGRIEVAA